MSPRRLVCVVVLSLLVLAPVGAELGGGDLLNSLMRAAFEYLHTIELTPEQALAMAAAARRVDSRDTQERFLRRAASGGTVQQVAAVELAELLATSDPGPAVNLVLPLLAHAETPQLREAAVAVVATSGTVTLDLATRQKLERSATRLSRGLRRRVQLSLALGEESPRPRLGRLLAESTSDLAALKAAQALAREEKLTIEERWWLAQTHYRHALYDEAAPQLEALEGVRHHSVPGWKVAFFRGRCGFRCGRWEEAKTWYRKALVQAPGRERRANLEVHLARTHELAGELDEAIAGARRAVRLRTTDLRRLFLARLRLSAGQPELATVGLSRIRGSSSAARGQLLVALYEVRVGEVDAAERRLRLIRRRPWSEAAAVLAAQLAANRGDWALVAGLLKRAGRGLGAFWAQRARLLLETAPASELASWRRDQDRDLAAAAPRTQRRARAIVAALEFDLARLEALRRDVRADLTLVPPPSPVVENTLAARLWAVRLEKHAVRWDPGGLGRSDGAAALHSAGLFSRLGAPRRAIRSATAALQLFGRDLPARAYPVAFRGPLFPLPWPEMVGATAAGAQVPWSLLAALVREESRWDPQALSAVGARGLAQLMPATARTTALRLGDLPPAPEDLFEPGANLRLGAAELGRLLVVFSNRRAPAVAAYNAGEAQARLWLEQCGSDCTVERFVAGITFKATRGYTADVLVGASDYAELYQLELPGSP